MMRSIFASSLCALLLAACSGSTEDAPREGDLSTVTSLSAVDGCSACMYHNLVWSDEFNGSGQPSADNWNYHVGNGYNGGAASFGGWGNGEWEWYRPEQAYLEAGNLVIRADFYSAATNIAGRDWHQRSARITTEGKRSWNNARVEARIAMPAKAGAWPAFWMMGDSANDTYTSNYSAPMSYYDTMAGDWPSCGEIDIMEHVNADAVSYQNLFWDTRTGLLPWASGVVANNPSNSYVGDVTQFHTYAMEWNNTDMYWYIDNARVKSQSVSASTMEEYRQNFHIILNLALAGQFPNTDPQIGDFPLFMRVDYVRVYQAGAASPTSGAVTFDSGDQNAASPAEWDTGYYKGDCGSCSVATGLSQRTDLSAAHALLCAPNCTFTGTGVTTLSDIASGDHRRASRAADWDSGYYKSECGLNEYVSGISMDSSSKRLHGLRCASASLASGGANNCETRLVTQDDRGDTAYGDWDYGYSKAQCSAGKVIYGVSTVPTTGRPHRILCCSF